VERTCRFVPPFHRHHVPALGKQRDRVEFLRPVGEAFQQLLPDEGRDLGHGLFVAR
jgi:hypothetical protein